MTDLATSRRMAWERGLVQWYLHDSQAEIYLLLLQEKYPFVEAARRFGKTTSIACFVIEQLRIHPGWIARWCFPYKNQARDVLLTEFAKIQAECPDHLRFKYQTIDSVFVGPGNSRIYIRGVNEDRGESARGPAANIIIADEYGFWKDPSYIIKNVLFPQLEGQAGRWLVKASTPPPDLGHVYYEEKEAAIRKGRFIKKTIYDKETLTQEELAEIIEECGGVESESFRRERLCEEVTESQMLVVPEYLDQVEGGNVVPSDYPRPKFFTPYVGGDSGADDLTAILFGYYDFQKNEIVVEDELVLAGETTGTITRCAKEIEARLWGELKPYKRVYDADKQLIFDLYGEYDYPMYMAEKSDKKAAIHSFRLDVQSRRFKIKEHCTQLRRQIRVGRWKDEKKLDFQRSGSLGHLDAIAAAIYFHRSIDTSINPVPQHYGYTRETHHINPPAFAPSPQDKTAHAIAGVFGAKGVG